MTKRSVAVVAVLALAAGCSGQGSPQPQGNAPAAGRAPTLNVEVVTAGLTHGWDVGFLPDGKALVTQRPGKLTLLSSTRPGATATAVQADFADLFARSEGGLMGLLVHPAFATNRRFVTCQTTQADTRLVNWRLSEDGTRAERTGNLLTGIPVSSGRHSGCRMELANDGSLLVGTGDAARAASAQDRNGLGGKVLRLDLETGGPAPGNPFAGSADPQERLLWTYGHRNVQGLAKRPGTDQVFAAEHGPDVDDEVNLLRPGGNYGWDPSRGGTVGGYDEDVPMTDLRRFPDAVAATWSSGSPTEALCGAAFLSGLNWGDLDGTLAVTALKGSKLMLFTLDPAGAVRQVATPAELNDTHGRLRGARPGPDGALYVTTSNGDDDKLLRISR
ncbi:PQQ-dependent sugar dehydrogenase [Allokutzneria albata]|uniref:Glucose/arabinose dehydrogenase, beta-propeller fold n=1 Tax=Allokutzneria albata TaxID=211114 RepID=A0A1G9YTP7_ALLAB|nr:PQQ-dependent sugar dehydrogenase [Allokutzneria albata]SDN11756.1 Glucose/arabinose dehydrogenase, beta-propeller fold [Allokutzneria albata]